MSRDQKQNTVAHEKFYGGKIVSPHEMLCLLRKNEHNRMWILKQLSQLGIDVNLLEDYSLSDLYRHCDQIIKSTYSIKYLGMNQNQMGIISRRIDPFKDNNFNLKSLPQSTYTVNKFFFPKPLKVGRKEKKQQQINIDNLQAQIKKAFLKNNPNLPHKTKNKTLINGSWINSTNKKQKLMEKQKQKGKDMGKEGEKEHEKEDHEKHKDDYQNVDKKSKSYSTSKHEHIDNIDLKKSSLIKIPDICSLKKSASSYSRFLSSGLVFQKTALDSCLH